ncbi:MAG: hypothetical protein JXR12_05305 [Neptunomonas phycophila]|uniref:hypothetical protein n=1 Tax=Neptunomonas phycophila TaxID=1572645 RepID=UPI003B8BF94B
MSAFSDFVNFVQAELFKRPFTNADPAKESVLVRRGGAPRQMQAVELQEEEVLTKRGGTLQGVPLSEVGGVRSEVHIWQDEAITWTVDHTKGSRRVVCQVVDENNQVVIPDKISFPSTSRVVINFTQPQKGELLLTWVDSQPIIHSSS